MPGLGYALVHGVSEYRDPNIFDLRYGGSDAVKFGEALRGILGWGDRVRIVNEYRSIDVMMSLQAYGNQLKAGDTFVYFFAGHGIQLEDDQILLLSSASKRLCLHGMFAGNDVVSLRAILLVMASWPEGVNCIVILDACRSHPYAEVANSYAQRIEELLLGFVPRDLTAVRRSQGRPKKHSSGTEQRNAVLVHSCGNGGRAVELEELGGGVFTECFIRQLAEEVPKSSELFYASKDQFDAIGSRINSALSHRGIAKSQIPWLSSSIGFILPIQVQRQSWSRSFPVGAFKEVEAAWCPEVICIPVDGHASSGKSLLVGRDPITIDQYCVGLKERGHQIPARLGAELGFHRPVTGIPIGGITAWLEWLNEKLKPSLDGSRYRLLTEEEWMHCCVAGASAQYLVGNQPSNDIRMTQAIYNYLIPNLAGERAMNFHHAGLVQAAQPVDDPRNVPNTWGIRGMHGNVWEIVTTQSGKTFVAKGGAYDSGPADLKVSAVKLHLSAGGSMSVGFRICRSED